MRRRGFSPIALRKLILDIGVTPRDSTIAFENLAAYNRKVVDKIANRYFFVEEPVKIKIACDGQTASKLPKSVKAPLHPTMQRGYRVLRLNEQFEVYVDRSDFERHRNSEVRLKYLCNVLLNENAKLTNIEVKKGLPIIHWVPVGSEIEVKLIRPEKTSLGVGEVDLLKESVDAIVQFERVGFARIEKVDEKEKKITAVFGHK